MQTGGGKGIAGNVIMANEIIINNPGAVAVPGAAAVFSMKMLYDVCGPTAKYLGGKFANYTEIGVHNLERIFKNAAKQLQAQNTTEGQVPPRVLKEILSEGYFCEDELQAMYLGGVLASSKGPVSRDDRAIAYCSLVSSLSSYQLRTHCILYSTILRATYFEIGGKPHPLNDILKSIQNLNLTILIREADYRAAMEFSEAEQPENIAQHSFIGLEKKGLSERGIYVCPPRNPKHAYPPGDPMGGEVPFRYFYPTILGVELFLWGQGFGDRGLEAYKPDLLQTIKLPFAVEPYQVYPGEVSFH